MPMAEIGPSERVLVTDARSRHSRPRMTVIPLAAMGSTVPRQASFIACQVLSVWCSSSR